MEKVREISLSPSPGLHQKALLRLPEGPPRGAVQIIHGMAEHIRRYAPLARALGEAGYLVAGQNLRGHGEEAPLRGYFARRGGWDALLADIHALRLEVARLYPGLPHVLLGHSMGSFLARCYLAEHGGGLQGAVLSGTGSVGRGAALAGRFLAGGLVLLGRGRRPAKLLDALAFSGNNRPFCPARTPFDWLSRDATQVAAYAQDPLCGFVLTGAGYRDLFTGLLRLREKRLVGETPKNLPLLFLSGDRDPVEKNGAGVLAAARAYSLAGAGEVTVKLYPQARHEVFNEENREEVYRDLLCWLEGLPGGPGKAPLDALP